MVGERTFDEGDPMCGDTAFCLVEVLNSEGEMMSARLDGRLRAQESLIVDQMEHHAEPLAIEPTPREAEAGPWNFVKAQHLDIEPYAGGHVARIERGMVERSNVDGGRHL